MICNSCGLALCYEGGVGLDDTFNDYMLGCSVFVQISDENVHLVRTILDEDFGSENFVSQFFTKKLQEQAAKIDGR